MQLNQFSVEVGFRITNDPLERGYFVSKSSLANGSILLDQNYALFITPLKKIGGGFKAANGTYHYVYSEPLATDVWHVAKLTYDGTVLRLSIDGASAASRTIGNLPDTGQDGALRIGANANGAEADKFFVGDLSYVKILDRSTFKKVYFNDFADNTGPGPDPDPGGDCSDIPISDLRGAVFVDNILARFENDGGPSAPSDYVNDTMKYIKANDMNLVRVPFYWEAYVSWPAGFMNELELLAKAAEDNDVCVILDNHHWYTSSYFKNLDLGKSGTPKGFPSFVMQGYPTTGDYETVAGAFWQDFLSNNITIAGKSVWELQAEFLAKVINKVDSYDSIAGYEILNEPHLFDSSQYDMLGNYHSYMAGKIREISDKKIVFNRETARGFQRSSALEDKIVPQGVSGLVYGPHLYAVPTPGSQGEIQVNNFKQQSLDWGVELLVGEWSAESQQDMDRFVTVFDDNKFGWTYYKWSASRTVNGDSLGNVIYDSDRSQPTIYLQYLVNSLESLPN